MKKKKRMGILGGTFNPIHSGHLLMAEGAREKLMLDEVLFIPCALSPLKKSVNLIPARRRLAMVRAAARGNPVFKVLTMEIKRGGRSYSVDTLQELHKLYKKTADFFFIIGSDSMAGLPAWKNLKKLMKLGKIIAVSRPGYTLDYPGVKLIKIPTLPVSSTDIRHLVRQGRSIKYLVPEQVRKYILKYKIYQR